MGLSSGHGFTKVLCPQDEESDPGSRRREGMHECVLHMAHHDDLMCLLAEGEKAQGLEAQGV